MTLLAPERTRMPGPRREPPDPPRDDAEPLPRAREPLLLAGFRAELRRRRSVAAARVVTASIAFGLLSVWLVHPPLTGGDENRRESAFPAWASSASGLADRLLDGQQYRDTDAALRDRLALRRYVAEAVGEASSGEAGSLSPRVVVGDGGMPFLAEDFTAPCDVDFDPAATDAGLRALQALGSRTGRTISVAIAPDKSSILTDGLGRRGPALMSCSDDVRRRTLARWPAGSGTQVLTVWDQVAAAEKAHPGKIYQYGDTHWTTLGALTFAQALVASLVDAGQAPAALRGDPVAKHVDDATLPGDLYRMMGVDRVETLPVYKVTRKHVSVTTKVTPTASGRGLVSYTATVDDSSDAKVPMVTGRTLVINDSFFSRAELELAPYFSKLTVMHYDDFTTAVRDGSLPDFDRLIIESVQRGWPARAGWLEPGTPVHTGLAAAMSAPARGSDARP
ncbi:hypothetical protein ACIB24_15315 [Spongisporangium articulatum]|uniref:AlgX/AlgJ SGNH hydrolase-like domain-containing protein n=1 Tax=Spongisporangium articulatum TaxID=3362603 RepID=A0ABW8AQQ9_9ACTN